MLQLKNITIRHKKDLRTIIEDFNLTLHKGDKAVIIGEEGNGKSTLIKLIYDVSLVEDYVEYEGTIIKNSHRLGYLAQELAGNDLELTVYEYCSSIAEFFELTSGELSFICSRLKVPYELLYSEQRISTLSGGEKVKLQLAKILMTNPDILLLDEPSNDIDMATLEWLEDFISSSELPILFISHDEMLIEETANIVIHIEQVMRKTKSKYTVSKMDYKSYIDTRMNQLTKQEQDARNEQREYKKQMERFLQIQQKVEHGQNAVSRQDPHSGQLMKKKMKSIKSMGRRFEREKENMTQVPDVKEAMLIKFVNTNGIPAGKKVIELDIPTLTIEDRVLSKNIHLLVQGNEKVCIVGKNGIGKSTLLKVIKEELLQRTDIKAGYMPQNYEDSLELDITPVEYLTKIGSKEENTRIRTYLGSMKYTIDEMNHPMKELSGGQKAKVLLLKMSLDGVNVLILDEPTRNFSPLSSTVICQVLKEFEGVIISISHDRKYMDYVCDTVYELTIDGLKKVDKTMRLRKGSE